MAVDTAELKEGAKGKAVHVLHTFGDSLWEMGCKSDPPEPFETSPVPNSVDETNNSSEAGPSTEAPETGRTHDEDVSKTTEGTSQQEDTPSASSPEATPQGWHASSTRHYSYDSSSFQRSPQFSVTVPFKPFTRNYQSSHRPHSQSHLPLYTQLTYSLLAHYRHKRHPPRLTSSTQITKT
jgi:hypothetical protein